MKDDNFTINVQIGGFRMPLRISRKDEEIYRNAEKLVVRHLDQYQKLYNQRPTEEILIMVAFKIATIASGQALNEDIEPLAQKIQDLNKELETLLQ